MAPCARNNEQGCCAGECQSSSSSDERALTQWGLMRSTEWKRITWFAEQRLQYVRNTRAIPVLKLNYDSYRVCFTGMNITGCTCKQGLQFPAESVTDSALWSQVCHQCLCRSASTPAVLSRHRYVDHMNVFKGLIWPTSHELRDGEKFRNKTAAREHGRFLALEEFISRVLRV